MNQTTILLLLFFCHFLADFTPLSTPWMLSAKKFGTPVLPILVHAAVHATLMGIALFILGAKNIPTLFILQLSAHFLTDVLKGRLNFWFPVFQNPANKQHWVLFGADQYLHAVVIIAMSAIAIYP